MADQKPKPYLYYPPARVPSHIVKKTPARIASTPSRFPRTPLQTSATPIGKARASTLKTIANSSSSKPALRMIDSSETFSQEDDDEEEEQQNEFVEREQSEAACPDSDLLATSTSTINNYRPVTENEAEEDSPSKEVSHDESSREVTPLNVLSKALNAQRTLSSYKARSAIKKPLQSHQVHSSPHSHLFANDLEIIEAKIHQFEIGKENGIEFGEKYDSVDDIISEVENRLFPLLAASQYQKAILKRYFDHLFQHVELKNLVKHSASPHAKEVLNATKTAESSTKEHIQEDDKENLVVRKVDGAFATALTPVRLHKKEKELLGVKYAVSPVRRSARRLTAVAGNVIDVDGSRTDKLLSDYDYAYTPNSFIPSVKY